MDDNSLAQGRHHAKQPIMNHKEVVNAIAKRTGVSTDDVDKVLCQLPILLEDSWANLVGVRLQGLGTFRGKLIPRRTGPFTGDSKRIKSILDTIAKDRIVPDLILDRVFLENCKSSQHFLDLEAFKGLAQEKLRRYLQTRPHDNYTQQKTKQAIAETLEENVTEDAPRRLHVELAFGSVAKTTN